MAEIYFSTFEKTDIARMLKECFAPESAYLYVESLWNERKKLKLKLDKIDKLTEEYLSDLTILLED